MKALLILLSLAFALVAQGGPLYARSCAAPRSSSVLFGRAQSSTSETDALSVTFAILAQTYCHADDESFTVRLEVRLHFTNVSDKPVILSKKIDNTDLVRVAKSVEAGDAGQFESAPNPDRLVRENPPSPPFRDAPDPKYFVILNPRQSYDVTIQTSVFGTKGPTSEHGLINRGTHVLRLGISTWPYYGYADVQNLRARWARFGDLQFGSVYTNFVPFEIPQKFENPACPSR